MEFKREENKNERSRNVSESEVIRKAGSIVEKDNIKHITVQNSTIFSTIKNCSHYKINIRSDLKINSSSIVSQNSVIEIEEYKVATEGTII